MKVSACCGGGVSPVCGGGGVGGGAHSVRGVRACVRAPTCVRACVSGVRARESRSACV